jgi:hypothetical protein
VAKTGGMLLKEAVASKVMSCVFNEPTTTPSTTVGNTSNSYTRSLNTTVINPNKSLVGIRSASKFHPLFYQTFQKITLDKWSVV